MINFPFRQHFDGIFKVVEIQFLLKIYLNKTPVLFCVYNKIKP